MKHNKITLIISFVLSLLLITIGLSFAYFTSNITGTESSTTIQASGGVMNIHYAGGENINAPNIFPSNDPFATKNFTLTGKSTTNDNMNYHIILVIEENTFTNNALQYKLTSTNTDGNGTIAPSIIQSGIANGAQEIYLGDGTFESPANNNEHSYTLELYFPETGKSQNDDMNKTFKAHINVREDHYAFPGYNPEKGVNHPVLFTGMTPVKWGEENNEIETTEDDPDWYDYNEKRWANAKSQDGSYWVWIPRYAYKIETCYHTSGADCLTLTGKEAGDIDVKFLKGTTNLTKDNFLMETTGYEPGVKDTSMHFFSHPVFQYNLNKLGFWMAKYEPSVSDEYNACYINPSLEACDNSSLTVRFIPNAKTLRFINISNIYKIATSLNVETDTYGWLPEEVDAHMMTNYEWGAVAYLSKSKYGAHDEEIWNNSYANFVTGCSGPNADASSQGTCTEYYTINGIKASTTHTIYGIYDMSGGAWELVMGNANYLEGKSGFTNNDLINVEEHHITRYYSNPVYWLNNRGMTYDPTVYGDAIYEISSGAARYNGSSWIGPESGAWYGDRSFLLHSTNPWFNRGGQRDYGVPNGIFHFTSSGGDGYVNNSFRITISPK